MKLAIDTASHGNGDASLSTRVSSLQQKCSFCIMTGVHSAKAASYTGRTSGKGQNRAGGGDHARSPEHPDGSK